MQRGQNIAIQINTKKEFVSDSITDQGNDMDKTEVERDSRILKLKRLIGLIIF